MSFLFTKFSISPAFVGALHCHAILAAVLFKESAAKTRGDSPPLKIFLIANERIEILTFLSFLFLYFFFKLRIEVIVG
jgi:hypothetical protein